MCIYIYVYICIYIHMYIDICNYLIHIHMYIYTVSNNLLMIFPFGHTSSVFQREFDLSTNHHSWLLSPQMKSPVSLRKISEIHLLFGYD